MSMTENPTTLTEDLRSKLKGVVEEVAHRFKGETGILVTLAKEHAELRALIDEVKRSEDANHRQELLQMIRIELLTHDRAEERTLHADLAALGLQAEIDRQSLEHRQIEKLLTELVEGMVIDPDASLDELEEALDAHVGREEGELFAAAKRNIPGDRLRLLGEAFEGTRERERERVEGTRPLD